MKHLIFSALRLILVTSIALTHVATLAPTSAATVPLSRFKTCDDLLSIVSEGRVEKYLLENAKDSTALVSLLNDYGAILSLESMKANLLTLAELKLMPNSNMSLTALFVMARRAANLTDAEGEAYAAQFLSNLKKIYAADDRASSTNARVAHVQITRLIEAIESSPQKAEIYKFIKINAQVITLTFAQLFSKGRIQDKLPGVRWAASGASIMALLLFADHVERINSLIHQMGQVIGVGFAGFASGAILIGTPLIMNQLLMTGLRAKRVTAHQIRAYLNNVVAQDKALAGSFDFNYMSADLAQLVIAGEKTYKDRVAPAGEETSGRNRALRIETALRIDNSANLSPVQITYVGQVDLLGIEEQVLTLQNAIELLDTKGATLQDIRSSAQQVAKDPNKFATVARFLRSAHIYFGSVESGVGRVKDLTEKFDSSVEKIKADFELLKKKPYQWSRYARSDEAVDKNELLLRTIQANLMSIDQLRFEREGLLKKIEIFEKAYGEYKKATETEQAVDSPSAAKQFAEEVLLLIDRLEAVTADTAAPDVGAANSVEGGKP